MQGLLPVRIVHIKTTFSFDFVNVTRIDCGYKMVLIAIEPCELPGIERLTRKYAVRNDQSILAHAPILVESQSSIPVSQLLTLESETRLLVFTAGLPCACDFPLAKHPNGASDESVASNPV